jgi:hypothetical protein
MKINLIPMWIILVKLLAPLVIDKKRNVIDSG